MTLGITAELKVLTNTLDEYPSLNAKKPLIFRSEALCLYARRCPTLPAGDRLVPLALEDLTAVFGMETGGAPPPISPGNT